MKLYNHSIICTRQEELGNEARFPEVINIMCLSQIMQYRALAREHNNAVHILNYTCLHEHAHLNNVHVNLLCTYAYLNCGYVHKEG